MQTEPKEKTNVTPKVDDARTLEATPAIQEATKKDKKIQVLPRVRCRRRF